MEPLGVEPVGWFTGFMIAAGCGILMYGLAHRYLRGRSRLVYFTVGFVVMAFGLAVWFYENALERNSQTVMAFVLTGALLLGGVAGVVASNHTPGDR